MATAKHEYCLVRDIRMQVKQQLEQSGLPKTGTESPTDFWTRVEKVGRLREALDSLRRDCGGLEGMGTASPRNQGGIFGAY